MFVYFFNHKMITFVPEYATLTRATLRQHQLNQAQQMQQQMQNQQQNSQQPDSRRNSAIISAMAEKVAAVNQLVAEQQQLSGNTGGSKSLNNSPVPLSMLTGQKQQPSAVVVQKPIAMLPPGSSSTLTRRCVTVCEDPVKAIHLQQQHQALRAQLAAAGGQQQYQQQQMMLKAAHGGSLKHGSSLAESGPTSTGILKPTATRAQQQQLRAVGGYSPGESSILLSSIFGTFF